MEKSKSCPLCGGGAYEDDSSGLADPGHRDNNFINQFSHGSHHDLQHIIYKHLHIEIIDNRVDNVCVCCKQTIVNWDEFAKKCWETQNHLEEKSNKGIKTEVNYAEIKVENSANDYDDDNDDKYSLSEYGCKSEDPLLHMKEENNCSKSNKRGVKKASGKKVPAKKSNTGDSETKTDDNSDDDYLINNPKLKKKQNEASISFVDFSCYICSAKTKSWVFLLRHFSKDHPLLKAKALCNCGKYLSSKRTIMTHNTLHDETRVLKCEECGKKFGDKHIFKEHMLIHFPDKDYRYSCSYCQKKFFQRHVLQYHVKTHLPPELKDTFTCDICGDKFGTKLGMQTHKLARHDNVRDHVCDQCGLSFVMKSQMVGHQKTVHNDIRNFECDKCPKKFKLSKHLKRHREHVHFPIEVKCPLCPTVLKNMLTFRKHKNIHHNST